MEKKKTTRKKMRERGRRRKEIINHSTVDLSIDIHINDLSRYINDPSRTIYSHQHIHPLNTCTLEHNIPPNFLSNHHSLTAHSPRF